MPGPTEGAIVIAAPERRVVEIDAFEAALIDLPVYFHREPPLARVEMPAASNGPKTVQADGRIYTVWFDARRQNRASRVDLKYKEFHFSTSVLRWQTVGGVTLPSELLQESWFNDSKSPDRHVTLSDVRIGRAAPEPPALPKPARGSLVMDERRHVIYRVDENWKRISDEQKVGNGDIGGE